MNSIPKSTCHRYLPWAAVRWAVLALLVTGAELQAAADPLATWHVRNNPLQTSTENLEGVAYGNGRWVVVGTKGSILSSPDGVEWTSETNPAGTAKLNDVTFAKGTFVAIGSGNNVVLTSPDGRQWTKQDLRVGGGLEIIHDGAQFVALAAGGFLSTSIDGVAWEYPPKIPTLYVDVGGIAYGKGTYVEVGYKRTDKPTDLWSATGGLTEWQFRDASSNENMFDVAYALGQFIAVGQKGTLITSPDGIQWTRQTVPHTGFIWDVAEGGSYLAAAAQWGRVLTSPDGVEWTRRDTGLAGHLTDIAFGNGTFIAVGWDGQIVQSDPLVAPSGDSSIVLSNFRNQGGDVQFTFTGNVGQVYSVEATTDWVTWNPVSDINCTASPMSVHLAGQNGTSRFYRVVQP